MKNKIVMLSIILASTYCAKGFGQTTSQEMMATPNCLASGKNIQINNEAVLQWKNSTKNQYRNRAHIQGTLIKDLPDHSGHHHYEIQIGASPNDVIEVIYNEQFGPVPNAAAGSEFEAYGDYITSNAPASHSPASPVGAIVHWVHKSPNPKSHDSGFLVVKSVLCGQDSNGAGPKH